MYARLGKVLQILLVLFIVVSLFRVQTIYIQADSRAQKLVQLINNYRVQHGLEPLKVSPILTKAAQAHSEDMAKRNYFGHYTPEGKSPVDRVVAAGYMNWKCVGENIAAGYTSPEAVFEKWKSSPGHNSVMLDPCFKEIGVGIAENPNSTYKIYWTADFGARYPKEKDKCKDNCKKFVSPKPPMWSKKSIRITLYTFTSKSIFNISRILVVKSLSGIKLDILVYDNRTGLFLKKMNVLTDKNGDAIVNLDLNYTGVLRIVVIFKGNNKYSRCINTTFTYSKRYYEIYLGSLVWVNGSWLSNRIIVAEENSTLHIRAIPVMFETWEKGYIAIFYQWNDGNREIDRYLKVCKSMEIRPLYIHLRPRYIPT